MESREAMHDLYNELYQKQNENKNLETLRASFSATILPDFIGKIAEIKT